MKIPYKIRPVILSGGSGSRLWPISTENYPKQFINFIEKKTLFETTLERLKKIKNLSTPLIITNEKYKFITQNFLKKLNIKSHIILEPESKNTVTSFYLSSLFSKTNELLLFLPSDHFIENSQLFVKILNLALGEYKENTWITFGIKPSFPHDGYGYIKSTQNKHKSNKELFKIEKFVEKPSKEKAKKMIKEKDYFWNSGIFIASSKLVKNTITKLEKDIASDCDIIWSNKIKKTDVISFDRNSFKKLRQKSIDYTLMEIPNKMFMYNLDVGWNDIGSWDSFSRIQKSKVIPNLIININSKNNYIYPTSRMIATIDVQDLIIVDSSDSLLISKKGSSEKIKQEIENFDKQFKNKTQHKKFIKPWGFYEILLDSEQTKVKRLNIFPNTRLSYQYHKYRNEHWVIISGIAEVKIDDKIKILHKNNSVYIKKENKTLYKKYF